ncbi:MAG: hypothetical protein V3U29_05385 [Phycisphaeraceae bacterium]
MACYCASSFVALVLLAPAQRVQPPAVSAQEAPLDAEKSPSTRAVPRTVQIQQMHRLHVTTSGEIIEDSAGARAAGSTGSAGGPHPLRGRIQGGCPQQVSSYTDADFEGGAFIVQAGFAEGEIAAASYILSPGDFPLRVDLLEMIFATFNATVETTTQWSVLVWAGTPDSGNLVAQFSSDGDLLPHIVLPPGSSGVNVAVSVDPGDPGQIIINDDGSHTFSIGYRIDVHNLQTQDPCFFSPPTCCNAFPATDISGLASSTGNWLFGIDCGPFGCPANGGWATFQELPGLPGELCTPSGDWVMRATWTPIDCGGGEPGACCLPDGGCFDVTLGDCDILQGSFEGEGTSCATTQCPGPTEACCFEGPPPGCLDLEVSNCIPAGGFPQGPGSSCNQIECFASGACCLPNGTCENDFFEGDCNAVDGLFQGSNTTCDTADCPDPEGACCFDTGFCLLLTEAQCSSVGASWSGALTDCVDSDGNGTADACEPDCPEDLNGNGVVNPQDLAILLGAWGDCEGCEADLNGDGVVGPFDLALLLGEWGPCP